MPRSPGIRPETEQPMGHPGHSHPLEDTFMGHVLGESWDGQGAFHCTPLLGPIYPGPHHRARRGPGPVDSIQLFLVWV